MIIQNTNFGNMNIIRSGVHDGKYCFAEDGSPVTGWLSDPAEENGRCYLDDRGRAVTGWQPALPHRRWVFI